MIVAGFGFRAGAPQSALRAALNLAQQGHGPIAALAAPVDKAASLGDLAHALGVPVIAITPQDWADIPTITRSAASLAVRGTGSVAEASALAAAGPGARLLGPRHVSADRMATCALATRCYNQGTTE